MLSDEDAIVSQGCLDRVRKNSEVISHFAEGGGELHMW